MTKSEAICICVGILICILTKIPTEWDKMKKKKILKL